MYILWKQRLFQWISTHFIHKDRDPFLLITIAYAACSVSMICMFSAWTLNVSYGLNIKQLTALNSSFLRRPFPRIHSHVPARVPEQVIPAVQTDCPAAARPAVRVSLDHNRRAHQTLVYTYNTTDDGLLIRYDVVSKKKMTLLSLTNVTISNAQLSTDGNFILFVTQVSGRLAIQMVRIDGQELQTLYCAADSKGPVNFIDDLLWSPDQQQILFRVPAPGGGNAAPVIQLLNLVNGSLQTVFAPSGDIGYIPRVWSSTGQVYMQGYALNTSDTVPPHDVYMLDVVHKSVRKVALISGYDWDMSVTPDGKELLLGQGAALPPQGAPLPPSFVSVQSASGGPLRVLYATHVYAVTQVRVVSSNLVLFVLGGRFASGAQDGLWSIHRDGSGLLHLTKDGKLLSDQHTPWSVISCDGRFYAVAGSTSQSGSEQSQTTILYGPLHGGAVVVVDTMDAANNAEIVGWTTL